MVSVGGKTRQQSVANGLDDLPDEAEIVLVHDAARPLVTNATIARVTEAARRDGAAIAALELPDTLKEVGDDDHVIRTVDRARFWRAQTPQGFRREIIRHAHADAVASRVNATDDAALCERIGVAVTVVRGSERALKITDEADFARAEALVGLVDES
jgi:2-C-methyl-D-erythritol 4-phosphate cytidylyltransferase